MILRLAFDDCKPKYAFALYVLKCDIKKVIKHTGRR